jgi:hypothetical protein
VSAITSPGRSRRAAYEAAFKKLRPSSTASNGRRRGPIGAITMIDTRTAVSTAWRVVPRPVAAYERPKDLPDQHRNDLGICSRSTAFSAR